MPTELGLTKDLLVGNFRHILDLDETYLIFKNNNDEYQVEWPTQNKAKSKKWFIDRDNVVLIDYRELWFGDTLLFDTAYIQVRLEEHHEGDYAGKIIGYFGDPGENYNGSGPGRWLKKLK